MTPGTSLRLRLLVLTMAPLLLVALVLGTWRYQVALRTAQDLFDRTLLASALAISRDVAISGGDAISPATQTLIRDASGGDVFYHVTGPGGFYVTGYAYPPKPDEIAPGPVAYGTARYRGEDVRILRLTERVVDDGLSGDSVISVWQRMDERQSFARRQALRSLRLMGALLLSLAALLWFGVARGLRPLTDLEAAIARRSPDDLTPIRRPVPPEVRGLVATLNRLLDQLQESMAAQQAFISDAAHQLRNPAAALLALAETLDPDRPRQERVARIEDLKLAARRSARLSTQLLSLERLRHRDDHAPEPIDLAAVVESICAEEAAALVAEGLDFELVKPGSAVRYPIDPVDIGEALRNLIDNARKHGGAGLSRITVTLEDRPAAVSLTVADDGVGLPPADAEHAFTRFAQLGPGAGSGLGLAIARTTAQRYGGELRVEPAAKGARLSMVLPRD